MIRKPILKVVSVLVVFVASSFLWGIVNGLGVVGICILIYLLISMKVEVHHGDVTITMQDMREGR